MKTKTKKLLLAIVAIVAYASGVGTFIAATGAHVWHILSVPTYQVTAASFVLANIAVTMLYGPEKGYASLMMKQGCVLFVITGMVHMGFPMCAHMARGMLYPTLGMIALGLLCKVASKAAQSVRFPYLNHI